jgi:hypothetical protein
VYDGVADSPGSFDFAATDDSYVVTYGANDHYDDDYVEAVLMGHDGAHIHTWHVISDGYCLGPTVATLSDRFLLVWLDGGTGVWKIRREILDPSHPIDGVTGVPIAPSFGEHGAPYLVPGPDQILCVFPADLSGEEPPPPGSTGYDIYALRFDLDGEPIDAEPIPLCRDPGDQRNVRGVWDSNQYLVTWRSIHGDVESLYGGRIGANGAVIDTSGFLIAEDVWANRNVASDPLGNVAAAYDGHKIRLIEDIVPLSDDDYWPYEDDPVDPDTTAVAEVWIGRPSPNPNPGGIRLEIGLPAGTTATVTVHDAAGRRLFLKRLAGQGLAERFVWDGRLPAGERAPAGIYFLHVSVDGELVVRKALLLR